MQFTTQEMLWLLAYRLFLRRFPLEKKHRNYTLGYKRYSLLGALLTSVILLGRFDLGNRGKCPPIICSGEGEL